MDLSESGLLSIVKILFEIRTYKVVSHTIHKYKFPDCQEATGVQERV
jgi:hypothetical protein